MTMLSTNIVLPSGTYLLTAQLANPMIMSKKNNILTTLISITNNL